MIIGLQVISEIILSLYLSFPSDLKKFLLHIGHSLCFMSHSTMQLK